MWEQVAWVLASAAGLGVTLLPGLGPGAWKTLVRWGGITLFSLPWFWLPFTAQPRMAGRLAPLLTTSGIAFFVVGIALAGLAGRVIHGVIGWGQVDPTRLVREGPYRLVRHPLYSGLAIGVLGWNLLWGGLYGMFLTPAFFALLRLEAWIEEKFILERKFGNAYAAYRREVPALLPVALAVPVVIVAILTGLNILLG